MGQHRALDPVQQVYWLPVAACRLEAFCGHHTVDMVLQPCTIW
jgi:hypothetical protein